MAKSKQKDLSWRAFELMCTAKTMAEKYESNKEVTAKYVHATSRGHEAIQLAVGMQLKAQDWVAPYYRDDSILLGIGMKPEELMLQVFAKKDDPFSGGRTYYSHPSLNRPDLPKIPQPIIGHWHASYSHYWGCYGHSIQRKNGFSRLAT